MSADLRGWKIAVLAESLMNPAEGSTLPAVLEALEACGYGLLQLPPPGPHRLLLAVIADQLAEYMHHGYAVAAVGLQGEPDAGLHWRRLAPLLRNRGVGLPLRHVVRRDAEPAQEGLRLREVLSQHDLSAEEIKRWRV